MFEQWGNVRYYPVTVGGREETVGVKYSIVKPEAPQDGFGYAESRWDSARSARQT